MVDLVHTYTPEERRGQGLAAQLTEAALAWARTNNSKVRASCTYVRQYTQKNPTSADLVN